MDALDFRPVGEAWSPPGENRGHPVRDPDQDTWLRARGRLPDDPLLHACVVAYASDLTLLGTATLPHPARRARHRVHDGEPRPRDVVPPAVPRRRVAAVPRAQPVGAARRAASPPARSSAPTAPSRSAWRRRASSGPAALTWRRQTAGRPPVRHGHHARRRRCAGPWPTPTWATTPIGEDPTVRRLESLAAALLGKEAALYVPSGTMANQLALRVARPVPGTEVLCGERAHVYRYEHAACRGQRRRAAPPAPRRRWIA